MQNEAYAQRARLYRNRALDLRAKGLSFDKIALALFGRDGWSGTHHPKFNFIRDLIRGTETFPRLEADPLEKAVHRIERGLLSEAQHASPRWERSPPSSSPGTPLLFLSDIHAGEVVALEEMSGHNSFCWEIMEARLDTIFDRTFELLFNHLAHPSYDGIVVALGGDMVTGEIHQDLLENNDRSILEASFELSGILAAHMYDLAEAFGKVHLVGVPGNHGRLGKPHAKGYTRKNADYHTYRQMQRALEIDPRFSFHFPLSADARFDVAGRRFLLTHGDQFRGGDGMVGPIGPVMRGLHKKHAQAASWHGLDAGAPFDTMLVGHFHQTFLSPRLIMNGSVKGYDEWAQQMNFYPEKPTQTLLTVHPKHGITWLVPIYAEPYPEKLA